MSIVSIVRVPDQDVGKAVRQAVDLAGEFEIAPGSMVDVMAAALESADVDFGRATRTGLRQDVTLVPIDFDREDFRDHANDDSKHDAHGADDQCLKIDVLADGIGVVQPGSSLPTEKTVLVFDEGEVYVPLGDS